MITDPFLRATKEKQLIEARAAYHSLMTNTAARVVVDQNGERVEFAQASRASLYSYILQLESELGGPAQTLRPSGPAMFSF